MVARVQGREGRRRGAHLRQPRHGHDQVQRPRHPLQGHRGDPPRPRREHTQGGGWPLVPRPEGEAPEDRSRGTEGHRLHILVRRLGPRLPPGDQGRTRGRSSVPLRLAVGGQGGDLAHKGHRQEGDGGEGPAVGGDAEQAQGQGVQAHHRRGGAHRDDETVRRLGPRHRESELDPERDHVRGGLSRRQRRAERRLDRDVQRGDARGEGPVHDRGRRPREG